MMFSTNGFSTTRPPSCAERIQFGNAGFDVGDDLRTVGRILVSLPEALQITLQLLVGIDVQRESDARYAAFLTSFMMRRFSD